MTKNTWLVGIGHSMQDAADTLIPEMFLEKTAGYEEWFEAKGRATQVRLASRTIATRHHDVVRSGLGAANHAPNRALTLTPARHPSSPAALPASVLVKSGSAFWS